MSTDWTYDDARKAATKLIKELRADEAIGMDDEDDIASALSWWDEPQPEHVEDVNMERVIWAYAHITECDDIESALMRFLIGALRNHNKR